jgi:hypothetical protein
MAKDKILKMAFARILLDILRKVTNFFVVKKIKLAYSYHIAYCLLVRCWYDADTMLIRCWNKVTFF